MQHTRRQFLKHAGVTALLPALSQCSTNGISQKPNIIFIMIDDLGYGDIGCYGSTVNKTPNIDSLARSGMIFRDYHSNGPMCSPTRASLMTGMYQHRLGEMFEGALSGTNEYDKGLPLETYTLADALKESGYATGIYGKWHLGFQPPFLPVNHGFDEFIGLGSGDGDHHTHIDRSGRNDWWHNNQLEMEAGYSTDLITGHSIDFIKAHSRQPFFLYFSHVSIHFPWQGPNDPPHRVEGIDYADDKWGIIPDKNNVSPHVKAMVESIDLGVGRIMQTLQDLDLKENTLVIFTSDNGGYRHYGKSHFNISSNGPLRGQKSQVYEGGHRVPCIASWPGTIPAGDVSDETIMTMDMFPTFVDLARADIPTNLYLDGISLVPHLLHNAAVPERAVCWKIDNIRAIRKGNWKLCLIGNTDPELYNLSNDIGETNNCAADNPELVQQLMKEYSAWEQDVTVNYQ